jgi:hypothetical protein
MRFVRPGILIPLLALVFLSAGATARAQTTSETIPVDLVNALFSSGGANDQEFFVGATPQGWPAALLPSAPARTLGGIRSPRQLVAVFVDSTSREPFAAYERTIQNAGFARPSSRGSVGFLNGGFQGGEGRISLWCSDSAQVITSSQSSTRALTYIRVTYATAEPRSICSPMSGSPMMRRDRDPRFTQLAIPPLYPPSGVQTTGSGSGGSGNTMHATTSLDSTSLTPAAVLQHYSAQLVAAGWTAMSSPTSTSFASQLFEARDDLKRTWHGVLLVMSTGAKRNVTLMMARPEDRGDGGSWGTLQSAP